MFVDQVPLAMDACGSHVVAAYAPLDIKVWRIDVAGIFTASGKPSAKMTIVRELSIMSVGQPLRVSILHILHDCGSCV